jgi:hypothetical protein
MFKPLKKLDRTAYNMVYVGYEVLTAVDMKSSISCDITPSSPV